MSEFGIKRVYEEPASADGWRVLVDRLWPRGVSKEDAALDEWNNNVAPSPDLRRWWDHDATRLTEFAERYRAELDESDDATDFATECKDHKRVTLLYGARDPKVNHAAVLRDWLEHHD